MMSSERASPPTRRVERFGIWGGESCRARAATSDDARRIYRTGDLGYEKPDGTFMYCGRRDQQVKVCGVCFNIRTSVKRPRDPTSLSWPKTNNGIAQWAEDRAGRDPESVAGCCS